MFETVNTHQNLPLPRVFSMHVPSLVFKQRYLFLISSLFTSHHHLSTFLLQILQAQIMDRGKKRAIMPSAANLAKKQKLDADDKRIIQEAKARIRSRSRSQTRRDDL